VEHWIASGSRGEVAIGIPASALFVVVAVAVAVGECRFGGGERISRVALAALHACAQRAEEKKQEKTKKKTPSESRCCGALTQVLGLG